MTTKTIRQHLLRRQRYAFWVTLAMFTAATMLWMASEIYAVPRFGRLGEIALLAGTVGFLVFHYIARCPRCRGNVGSHAHYLRLSRFPGLAPARFCPFCGVSLDAPVGREHRP
jgi:hypothetical protein